GRLLGFLPPGHGLALLGEVSRRRRGHSRLAARLWQQGQPSRVPCRHRSWHGAGTPLEWRHGNPPGATGSRLMTEPAGRPHPSPRRAAVLGAACLAALLAAAPAGQPAPPRTAARRATTAELVKHPEQPA